MKSFKIALYPGDGIGPEVLDQTVRVLEAVESQMKTFTLETTQFPWGADYWIEYGQVAPPDFLDLLRPFDAILLGAIGDPSRIPDHVTLDPLIQIRQRFDQYACVRPARLFPGVPCPLTGNREIDLVVIRENSEGEYVNNGGRFKAGAAEEFALQTAIHTRRGIERILRFGFEMAAKRRQQLTMITKSNALRYGMVLWDEILEEISPEFPAIRVDKQHIDAASMNFVRSPEKFDVVVASNLFGDILSDLAGIITGGLGLPASANINPERKHPSMFESVHGSAPDIIGLGIANPVAEILSAAMMLDWLELNTAAECIRRSVESTLRQGAATPDLGGQLNTVQMTDLIIKNLEI
ncbi:MAG: tartrate dehydrogenase [SAR324 cluster bacterium]|nr:tartrate dehydrogenase [SAR324 cluster bacterium]